MRASKDKILLAAWNVWEDSNGNNWGYVLSQKYKHYVAFMDVKYDVGSNKVKFYGYRQTMPDVPEGISDYTVGSPYVEFRISTRERDDVEPLLPYVTATTKSFFKTLPPNVISDGVDSSLGFYRYDPEYAYSAIAKAYFLPVVSVNNETLQVVKVGGYTKNDFKAMFDEFVDIFKNR